MSNERSKCKNYTDEIIEITEKAVRKDKEVGMADLLNQELAELQKAMIEDMLKQARKETAEKFAKKIQDYLNDKVCEEFGDNACDVTYFTIDVDKVISDVFEIAQQFGVEVEE